MVRNNDEARESRNRTFRMSMIRASESTDEEMLSVRYNEAKVKFEEMDDQSKEHERVVLNQNHAKGKLMNVNITKNGGTYVFTVSLKERKKVKKGPILLLVGFVFLAVVVGFMAVEHPADSIDIDSVSYDVYVEEDSELFVRFTPSYTTDKTLEWSANHPGVTFEITEDGAVMRVSPSIPDGTELRITAKSMKYGVSGHITLNIINDSYLRLVLDENVSAGKTYVAEVKTNASWEDVPVWETDCDWAVVGKTGFRTSVHILPDAAKGDTFTLSCSIPGTSMKVVKTVKVSKAMEVSIIVPDRTIDAGSSMSLKVGLNTELPGMEYTWAVTGDHASIVPSGASAEVILDYAISAGEEFTVSVSLNGTHLGAAHTFTVDRGVEPTLNTSSQTLAAGSSITLTLNSPVVPPEAEVVWTVDSEDVELEGNGQTVTIRGSPDMEHGIKITVTASYQGLKPVAYLTIDAVNEALRFIELSSAQDMLDIDKAPGRNYRLACDIDMSSVQWVPFKFTGKLDGAGHTLTGLTFTERNRVTSGNYYGGLFSVNDGTISDLSLDSCTILIAPNNYGDTVSMSSGFFAGNNNGTITNCDVSGSDMTVHSTDIKIWWKEKGNPIPNIGGDGRNGKWYEYASLSFTDKSIVNWKQDKGAWLQCGGMAGTNSGTITSCTVTDCSMDVQIVNFQHNNGVRASYTELLMGGAAGYNTGTLSVDVSDCDAIGGLVLHDSGDNGWGYLSSSKYKPHGAGYIGGIAGVTSNSVNGSVNNFNAHSISEAYAPAYYLFQGAFYTKNDCYSNENIKWDKGSKVGMMK